jgi:MYXO-CTERM domain-containing protein
MRAAAVSSAWIALAAAATAAAAPVPEPAGAHPRMLLDDELRAAWRADANAGRGPVAAAIALCREGRETGKHDRGGEVSWPWAKVLQACLVAWAATDAPEHAATALRFFTALLDDLEVVGDGKGGDASAQRDDGYAIRTVGPFTAIAYDWLHAAPGMTPELRARARGRWHAWLTWYRASGYRARFPGTNYQAGFLAAATAIAIAQGGEAGLAGAELWRFVAGELWAKDMAAALAPGGILEGGDWPEGWQYGPLAIAHYALAARIARRAGIPIAGVEAWLSSVMRRHVHGLSPAELVHAGGDTEHPGAQIPPRELTLTAIALGDAAAQDRRWARAERARLGLADEDALLFDALGMAGGEAEAVPRASWPTWYLARGTGTIYARTRWDDRAIWFVAECQRKLPVDHRNSSAGNFVLSRGRDDVIVDPSPYGSLSTLTSNAPTVASAQLPARVIPGQGRSGRLTRWRWATQTRSGVVAARCDYADQYRLEHAPSDVREAIRDLIVLPSAGGTDASVVVVDRAVTGDAARAMYLRFRVPGTQLALAPSGDVATATLGQARLAIAGAQRSAGRPRLVASTDQACTKLTLWGHCEAARIAVTDYRLEIAGPAPRAVHAIAATAEPAPPPALLGDDGWQGVRVTAARDAVVVWPVRPGAALRYRAPRGGAVTHVVLDPPAAGGAARITARLDGDACAVEVAAGEDAGAVPVVPVIIALDDACAITADAERPGGHAELSPASPSAPAPEPPPVSPSARRPGGCCGAQASPSSSSAALLVVVVGAALLHRRRRA